MRAELVFIPDSGAGHMTPTVETARRILDRDDRLSITFLIIPSRHETASAPHLQSLSDGPRLRFIILPRPDLNGSTSSPTAYMEAFKPLVRDAVSKLTESTRPDSPRLAGFVLDMFCVEMIDVANDFGVPSYMFYVCCAGFLGLQLHVQRLHDEGNYVVADLKDSKAELDMPCFRHPYPAKCLPSMMLNAELLKFFLHYSSRYKETRGIIVNSFAEFETYTLESFAKGNSNCPPVYPVGPILKLKSDTDNDSKGYSGGRGDKKTEIMKWLDGQPPKSVVFLCFGSMGGFNEDQIREMARGIERSGHRFLCSVRRASEAAGILTAPPEEFANIEEVLPEGFLDRTREIGKIIGWAPQLAVLGHPAVGGYVSHSGWNSALESLWLGVPMATLPMHAENQVNAFVMVVELGLAVEIRNDFRNTPGVGMVEEVRAEEIENGIRKLMEPESEVRKRVEEMSWKCREVLGDGGSSHDALGRFIGDVLHHNNP